MHANTCVKGVTCQAVSVLCCYPVACNFKASALAVKPALCA